MPSHRPSPKPHTAKQLIDYRDIFDVRDPGRGPLVLADCTSIEWPRGRKQEDADRWRKANRLERRGAPDRMKLRTGG